MNLKPIGSNQTEVELNSEVTVLFSYRTPVACCIQGEGWYRTEESHSKTTSRHINKWLDGVKATARPQAFFDNLAGEAKIGEVRRLA